MGATYVLLLSTLGLIAIHTQAQDCPHPVAGDHMTAQGIVGDSQTFPSGTKVTFACNLGYISAGGSPSITCNAGTWSPLALKCQKRNCGSAGEVLNGDIDYAEGTEFGAKIVVTCNSGYYLIGTSVIICGAQGWLSRLPTCDVIICLPPQADADSSFSPIKNDYKFLDVIQYTCQKDYTLSGSKTLSCSENGTFQPAPPTCLKVECEDPNIKNGRWVSGSRPPHKYRATLTLECLPGYTMSGSRTQTCDINSQWSPGLPTCQPVQCEDPKIQNADRVEGSQPPYIHQSTVTFECKSGYTMTGARTQTCGIDGQWSPGLPSCRPVQCEDPKIQNADRVEGSQPPYIHQSTVTFECKSGYTMTGARTQTCGIDGQWSPGLPSCQLKPTTTRPSTTEKTMVDPDTTDPSGSDGNAKAIGLGIGLTVLIGIVLTFCGCYFCGVPAIIKRKRRSRRGSRDNVDPKEETVTLS